MTFLNRSSRVPLSTLITAALLVLGLAAVADAQEQPAAPIDFLDEFQTVADRVGDRIVTLAEAIPAEQYDWRPGDGVRSVSEVLMHIAALNFGSAGAVGLPMPEDLPPDLSKVTAKKDVLAWLGKSYELIQGAAQGLAGTDLGAPMPGGGGQISLRGAMMIFVEHQGEHLGQLIAYARTVGVTPPWNK